MWCIWYNVPVVYVGKILRNPVAVYFKRIQTWHLVIQIPGRWKSEEEYTGYLHYRLEPPEDWMMIFHGRLCLESGWNHIMYDAFKVQFSHTLNDTLKLQSQCLNEWFCNSCKLCKSYVIWLVFFCGWVRLHEHTWQGYFYNNMRDRYRRRGLISEWMDELLSIWDSCKNRV